MFAHFNASIAQEPTVPSKTIVLCTDERTGSHLLAQILAETGVLGRAYEYFNTVWMREHISGYPEDPLQQLVWARRLGTTPNGVFSFKLHPWAIDLISPQIDIGVDLPDPYFVLLRRDDLLGQAISLLRAQQTLAYTSWSEQKAAPQYDGGKLQAILNDLAARRARWDVYFARNGIEPFRVEYAELTTKPAEIARGIALYCDVSDPPGKETWVSFDRQADELNEEWRRRFILERRSTRHLDRLD